MTESGRTAKCTARESKSGLMVMFLRENGKTVALQRELASGSVLYDGAWKEGFPDGKGTYNSKNGGVYTVEILANKKHGKGVIHSP